MERETVMIDRLNDTELVTLLQGYGIPAHRGLPRDRLQQMWVDVQETGGFDLQPGESEEDLYSPMDPHREEIMNYIAQYRDVLLPQLGCDGNCHNHPDTQVAVCYLRMKTNQ